jgi:hypothetical protein
MKRLCIVSVLSFILFSSCVTTSDSDRSMNESMLNFLPYLNQKIAGYISENNIKSLDADKYKEIVNAVCFPLPSCRRNAEAMFKTYTVDAHMLDGMFSIMLCDKDGKIKDMEDFSCDEEKVEIRSFEVDPKAQCQFEANWQEKIRSACPGFKTSNQPSENH